MALDCKVCDHRTVSNKLCLASSSARTSLESNPYYIRVDQRKQYFYSYLNNHTYVHQSLLHFQRHYSEFSVSFAYLQCSTCTSTVHVCHDLFFIFFSGYLYGHVSYLADDCEACLLLLSVDREQFFTLSEAKQKIVDVCCNCF